MNPPYGYEKADWFIPVGFCLHRQLDGSGG
jgi:hypothetical protein